MFIEVTPAGLADSDANKPKINLNHVVKFSVWDDGSHTDVSLSSGEDITVVGDLSPQINP